MKFLSKHNKVKLTVEDINTLDQIAGNSEMEDVWHAICAYAQYTYDMGVDDGEIKGLLKIFGAFCVSAIAIYLYNEYVDNKKHKEDMKKLDQHLAETEKMIEWMNNML